MFKLTSRSELAIRAMIELARVEHERYGLTAREVAERSQSSISFVEQVLATLRVGRLVQTRRGRLGGYRLSRPSESISIAEILQVTEGPLEPATCGGAARTTCAWCEPGPPCSLSGLWQEVTDALVLLLEARSLSELALPAPERQRQTNLACLTDVDA